MSRFSREDVGGVARSQSSRRRFLQGGGVALGGLAVAGVPRAAAAGGLPQAGGADPGAAERRGRTRFGIGYETWFMPGLGVFWTSPEAIPVLGRYRSDDPAVITQHAKWIMDAGIDFVLIDWSNNLGGNWSNGTAGQIIAGTQAVFQTYATLPRHPQITLLLGLDNGQVGTPNFNAQIQLITERYLQNAAYRSMLVEHDGKPLLTVYTGPTFSPPPVYRSDTFTVRMMAAYFETTLNPGGAWTWVDRVPIVNGAFTLVSDFAATGLNGWSVDPAWRLTQGKTSGLTFATCQTASGSQQTGTITSPSFAIDQDVLTFNAVGVDPSPVINPSAGSRNLFFLRDAGTKEELRFAEPPGSPDTFTLTQWDVRDLSGRQVVFQAVNGNTGGFLGFFGLAQQRGEQMAAPFGLPGQTGYRAPDAYPRVSGGYWMRFMSTAFDYEPEFVIVQQWNEFQAVDQYSPELSNDIEPTVVSQLAGADSDGWGSYYLDLTTEVIRQYRQGVSFPQVQLDTRYP